MATLIGIYFVISPRATLTLLVIMRIVLLFWRNYCGFVQFKEARLTNPLKRQKDR